MLVLQALLIEENLMTFKVNGNIIIYASVLSQLISAKYKSFDEYCVQKSLYINVVQKV
jgi:hypothetical protein